MKHFCLSHLSHRLNGSFYASLTDFTKSSLHHTAFFKNWLKTLVAFNDKFNIE